MKTVRQILAIAGELHRREEFSESNLISGLAFAAISDTKWFGTGLRDWFTLWNPESRVPAIDLDLDFQKVVLPVANRLIRSGRRSQGVRLIAALATVWPNIDRQQIDWKQWAKINLPKGPQPQSQEPRWLEDLGLVTQLKGFPEAVSILGGELSLGGRDLTPISYAEEYINSLQPKEPLLLSESQAQTVANAAYDFHWSGRSEAAVRLSTVLPRAAGAPEFYTGFVERTPLASAPRISQAAQIGLGLKSKGYSAAGSNLFLDSLSLEDDSPEWNEIFKLVEPTVQSATIRPPKAVYSWARGFASKLTNESPTASGRAGGSEATLTRGAGGPEAEVSPPDVASAGGGGAPPDDTVFKYVLEDEPDPPRSAYALLKCDDAVVAALEFPLTAGLAKDPTPDIFGDQKLERPATSIGPYTLQVQITADGFRLSTGESWRNEIPVTAEKPYPSLTLHLTPEMQSQKNIWARSITAVYSVDGHTIGVAVRSVAIVRTSDYLHQAATLAQDSSATFPIPTDTVPPDLTVSIVRGKSSGRLLWTLDTPWKDIHVPADPMVVEVGENGDGPKDYARQLIDSVNAHEGKATLYTHLMGRGLEVGDLVPAQFWDVLRAVATKSSRRIPTILILSAEPYIPWELAVLQPPLDPALPPFLGAQAIVGRWVLANRGPKLPPPHEQQVKAIAVVSGVYSRVAGWNRLEQAEAEALEIQTKWSGIAVDAETASVLKCINGTPPGDLLHFAVHGIYDPTSTLNGLVLVDGESLDPTTVKGSKLTRTPFVFLNACQVGQGNAVLGDYAGMAAAFLYAGASGVVAPLWSVKDTIAKEIALRFYEQAFDGIAPAEFLRTERSQFTDPPKDASATWLAYQYFGHPAMRLIREP
jgi:hypothetical protein